MCPSLPLLLSTVLRAMLVVATVTVLLAMMVAVTGTLLASAIAMVPRLMLVAVTRAIIMVAIARAIALFAVTRAVAFLAITGALPLLAIGAGSLLAMLAILAMILLAVGASPLMPVLAIRAIPLLAILAVRGRAVAVTMADKLPVGIAHAQHLHVVTLDGGTQPVNGILVHAVSHRDGRVLEVEVILLHALLVRQILVHFSLAGGAVNSRLEDNRGIFLFLCIKV